MKKIMMSILKYTLVNKNIIIAIVQNSNMVFFFAGICYYFIKTKTFYNIKIA